MVLLGAAAAWLLLTRPSHRIEGDFLEREDRRKADEWLREQTQSPVAETAARACLALGRIGDHGTLDLLLEAAESPAPRVRAAAAFAVGEIEDRGTVAASGGKPQERAAGVLIELLEDDERLVVANAVEALGKMEWRPVIERLKNTPSPHPFTLAAMARMNAVEAAPWIAQRLKSDDQSVRWAAADALNWLAVPCDEGITRSFLNLTRDRDWRVRAAVVEGLARAEPSEEVLAALAKMTDDPDPKVRIHALGSLAALGQEKSLETIVKGLGDQHMNVRVSAVEALGRLGSRRAIPLLQSLKREATAISRAAAKALATFTADGELPLERSKGRASNKQTPRNKKGTRAARTRRQGTAFEVRYTPEDYQRIARSLNRHLTMHTSAGSFELELDYDNAPLTAERFLELASRGYFDGQSFSVVERTRLAGFDASIPVQDEDASGAARCEINQQIFIRGSLAMVAEPKDSGGDRFFICLRQLPEFDGRYTNFGRLISGDSVIDEITRETQILQITSP